MKKILHVTARNPNGGVGVFLKNIYHYANNDKYQHDYLILTNKNKGEFERNVPKSNVYRVTNLKMVNLGKVLKELKELFKNGLEDYDVVHVHSPVIGLLIYRFSRKTKTIIHSHSNKISDTFLKRIRNSIVTLPLKFIPIKVVACSEEAGKIFKKNVNEIYIVNNGVNTENFAFDFNNREKMRREFNFENKIVLAHVGTFTRVKNQSFLLDLMVEIRKTQKDVVLLLIGDGENFQEIKKKCNKLGLNNEVVFLGAQSDVAKYLDMIDVFLLPSIFEGIPISLIEAQSKGLQCLVSTNVSNDAKVIDDLFHRMSLSNSLVEWKNKVNELGRRNYNRDCSHLIVKQKGYEINRIMKELNRYYSEIN